MARAASAPELKQGFENHLEQTRGQVERLEQIFQRMDKPARAKKCMGMEGLIEEGQELMKEQADPDVMDAGLIGAAQKVEHYEIAAYGTARTHAQQLGMNDAAYLLQQTLDEERQTDEKLTRIAEGMVNPQAAGGDGFRR
jgi:ferritin-like metal-binding protein YciE